MTAQFRAVLVGDLKNLRAMVEPQFGADDIRLIHVLRPLAALLVQDNALDEAVVLQRRIYNLCLKFKGNPNLPSLSEARKSLAASLQSLGQYDEALPLLQLCIAEDGDESATSTLVDCLQGLGRFQEAISLCEQKVSQAAQLDASKSGTTQLSWLLNLSRCYSRQDDYARAAEVIERTIPLMAARAEVLCIPQLDMLAELYRKAGNLAEHDRVRAKRREIADRCNY
ncbi:MAG: tetratricopeptide repeat protein [Cyanobacteria bacterium SZAS LIN-5]|nr:tetratricopeptide repeat protein [Cyanobacteria bacterium SZAS LIN-5]